VAVTVALLLAIPDLHLRSLRRYTNSTRGVSSCLACLLGDVTEYLPPCGSPGVLRTQLWIGPLIVGEYSRTFTFHPSTLPYV
jgi:hypothetical protein